MAWYRPDQTRRTDATEVAPLPCGTGSKAVKQTTKERFNEMEKAPAHRTDRSFHSTIKSESECRPMASRALWSEIVADTQTTHGERVRRGCLTCHFHTPSIQEDIWAKQGAYDQGLGDRSLPEGSLKPCGAGTGTCIKLHTAKEVGKIHCLCVVLSLFILYKRTIRLHDEFGICTQFGIGLCFRNELSICEVQMSTLRQL